MRKVPLTGEECYTIAHSPLPNKVLAIQYDITRDYVWQLKVGRARPDDTGIIYRQKRVGSLKKSGEKAILLNELVENGNHTIQEIADNTGFSTTFVSNYIKGLRKQFSSGIGVNIDKYCQEKESKMSFNFNSKNTLTDAEVKLIDAIMREDDSLPKTQKRSYEEILIKSGLEKTPSLATMRGIELGETRNNVTGRRHANKNTRKKLARFYTTETKNKFMAIDQEIKKPYINQNLPETPKSHVINTWRVMSAQDFIDINYRISHGENHFDLAKEYHVTPEALSAFWSAGQPHIESAIDKGNQCAQLVCVQQEEYENRSKIKNVA